MMDLVRKQRRLRGGRPRTGSAIGVSTVGNTGVLGLGFNPNQHIQEKQQEKKGLTDLVHKRQTKKPSSAGKPAPSSELGSKPTPAQRKMKETKPDLSTWWGA
jgi:hypothetical protein